MTRTKEEQITTIIRILVTIEITVIINLLRVTTVPRVATSTTALEEAIVAVMTMTIDVEGISREITNRIHLTRGDLSRATTTIPQVHKTSTDAMTITTIATVLDSSKTTSMIGISPEQAHSIVVAMDSMTISTETRIPSLTDSLKVAILMRVADSNLDATPPIMTSITTTKTTRVTIEEVTLPLSLAIATTEVAISTIIVVAIITISTVAHTITVVKA